MDETIIRRSNLFQYLEYPNKYDPSRTWKYPQGVLGSCYCPNVTVFRESEDTGYEYLEFPSTLSMICLPSIPWRGDKKNKLDTSFIDVFQRKMIQAMRVAIENDHDAVVLSAFGCGYNKAPPTTIASLFYKIIASNFPNSFKHVVFGIIDNETTFQKHNPKGNYNTFQDQFLKPKKNSKRKSIFNK